MNIELTPRQSTTVGAAITALSGGVILLVLLGVFILLARFVAVFSSVFLPLFVALILLGAFVNYTMGMFFNIPVFWMHSVEGVRNLYWSLGSTASRPHRIYRGVVLKLLTTVLPFALISSYPVDSLFNGEPGWTLIHMVVVALAAFLAMNLFWRAGLRAYSSASS